jgi:alkylhydroperoxidase family enzyme
VQGVTDGQLRAVVAVERGGFDGEPSADQQVVLFDAATRTALAYADAITTGDVSDSLFGRVREHFDDDQIVELTEVIAWENASARFNRALRIGSQHLWAGSPPDPVEDA